MNEKPKFLFEADPASEETEQLSSREHAETFFNTLQAAGIIQDAPTEEDFEAKKTEVEASMKKLESKVLLLEYGPYQDHYAIHLTPVHPQKNLSTEIAVKKALRELVVTLNEYVPFTCHVDLFPPNETWKMKVITAKVRDGMKTWNFDIKRLEEEGIPRIFSAVEKVIMS